jgi:hypothetical protein
MRKNIAACPGYMMKQLVSIDFFVGMGKLTLIEGACPQEFGFVGVTINTR